jgi:hypothetical protein
MRRRLHGCPPQSPCVAISSVALAWFVFSLDGSSDGLAPRIGGGKETPGVKQGQRPVVPRIGVGKDMARSLQHRLVWARADANDGGDGDRAEKDDGEGRASGATVAGM